MAWSDDVYITAFDAEAGDIAALATAAQKIIWFNEGMQRLRQWRPETVDITWSALDREVGLPDDFVQLDKIVDDLDSIRQDWRVWGRDLVMDDPSGASGDGSARVYYWAEFEAMTTSTTATELSPAQDYACLYYALHRFYKKLASNRLFYKRYSTLVGANASSVTDLQQESDRYLDDFLQARDDFRPEPPAYFYGK